MDNEELEKYKREVEQNQTREQGKLSVCFCLPNLFLSSLSIEKKSST